MGRLVFGLMLALGVVVGSTSADEAAVKKMVGDYANAFNSKQLDAVIGFWTENGVHVDRDSGERTEGREAIRADIAAAFEQSPGNRIFGRIERVHFVKPEIASVDGRVTVSSPDADPTESRFSAILVEQAGKWMIDSIEEFAVIDVSDGSEALADLQWLVGRWMDASDEIRVDTEFRWTGGGNFLVRSYAVSDQEGVAREGTEVIGWDPRSREIRSWSFSSDGSFGDGTWAKSGEDWLVKSSQTLPDGQAASGTFVLSRNGEDEMTLKLIGHEVEGEPQPTGRAVTAVRVVQDATSANAAESN